MPINDVKNFFNNCASSWDDYETKTDDEILDLLKKIKIKENDKILDVGCGTGRITSLLHILNKNNVIGIDLSNKMIEIARIKYKGSNYAKFVIGDFLKYDFDHKFDVIVVYNAYPHFLKPKLLNKALLKNLNDSGKFALIHSLSRAELSRVHNNMDLNLKRVIDNPVNESKFFSDNFNILKAYEDDKSYIIIGIKK